MSASLASLGPQSQSPQSDPAQSKVQNSSTTIPRTLRIVNDGKYIRVSAYDVLRKSPHILLPFVLTCSDHETDLSFSQFLVHWRSSGIPLAMILPTFEVERKTVLPTPAYYLLRSLSAMLLRPLPMSTTLYVLYSLFAVYFGHLGLFAPLTPSAIPSTSTPSSSSSSLSSPPTDDSVATDPDVNPSRIGDWHGTVEVINSNSVENVDDRTPSLTSQSSRSQSSLKDHSPSLTTIVPPSFLNFSKYSPYIDPSYLNRSLPKDIPILPELIPICPPAWTQILGLFTDLTRIFQTTSTSSTSASSSSSSCSSSSSSIPSGSMPSSSLSNLASLRQVNPHQLSAIPQALRDAYSVLRCLLLANAFAFHLQPPSPPTPLDSEGELPFPNLFAPDSTSLSTSTTSKTSYVLIQNLTAENTNNNNNDYNTIDDYLNPNLLSSHRKQAEGNGGSNTNKDLGDMKDFGGRGTSVFTIHDVGRATDTKPIISTTSPLSAITNLSRALGSTSITTTTTTSTNNISGSSSISTARPTSRSEREYLTQTPTQLTNTLGSDSVGVGGHVFQLSSSIHNISNEKVYSFFPTPSARQLEILKRHNLAFPSSSQSSVVGGVIIKKTNISGNNNNAVDSYDPSLQPLYGTAVGDDEDTFGEYSDLLITIPEEALDAVKSLIAGLKLKSQIDIAAGHGGSERSAEWQEQREIDNKQMDGHRSSSSSGIYTNSQASQSQGWSSSSSKHPHTSFRSPSTDLLSPLGAQITVPSYSFTDMFMGADVPPFPPTAVSLELLKAKSDSQLAQAAAARNSRESHTSLSPTPSTLSSSPSSSPPTTRIDADELSLNALGVQMSPQSDFLTFMTPLSPATPSSASSSSSSTPSPTPPPSRPVSIPLDTQRSYTVAKILGAYVPYPYLAELRPASVFDLRSAADTTTLNANARLYNSTVPQAVTALSSSWRLPRRTHRRQRKHSSTTPTSSTTPSSSPPPSSSSSLHQELALVTTGCPLPPLSERLAPVLSLSDEVLQHHVNLAAKYTAGAALSSSDPSSSETLDALTAEVLASKSVEDAITSSAILTHPEHCFYTNRPSSTSSTSAPLTTRLQRLPRSTSSHLSSSSMSSRTTAPSSLPLQVAEIRNKVNSNPFLPPFTSSAYALLPPVKPLSTYQYSSSSPPPPPPPLHHTLLVQLTALRTVPPLLYDVIGQGHTFDALRRAFLYAPRCGDYHLSDISNAQDGLKGNENKDAPQLSGVDTSLVTGERKAEREGERRGERESDKGQTVEVSDVMKDRLEESKVVEHGSRHGDVMDELINAYQIETSKFDEEMQSFTVTAENVRKVIDIVTKNASQRIDDIGKQYASDHALRQGWLSQNSEAAMSSATQGIGSDSRSIQDYSHAQYICSSRFLSAPEPYFTVNRFRWLLAMRGGHYFPWPKEEGLSLTQQSKNLITIAPFTNPRSRRMMGPTSSVVVDESKLKLEPTKVPIINNNTSKKGPLIETFNQSENPTLQASALWKSLASGSKKVGKMKLAAEKKAARRNAPSDKYKPKGEISSDWTSAVPFLQANIIALKPTPTPTLAGTASASPSTSSFHSLASTAASIASGRTEPALSSSQHDIPPSQPQSQWQTLAPSSTLPVLSATNPLSQPRSSLSQDTSSVPPLMPNAVAQISREAMLAIVTANPRRRHGRTVENALKRSRMRHQQDVFTGGLDGVYHGHPSTQQEWDTGDIDNLDSNHTTTTSSSRTSHEGESPIGGKVKSAKKRGRPRHSDHDTQLNIEDETNPSLSGNVNTGPRLLAGSNLIALGSQSATEAINNHTQHTQHTQHKPSQLPTESAQESSLDHISLPTDQPKRRGRKPVSAETGTSTSTHITPDLPASGPPVVPKKRGRPSKSKLAASDSSPVTPAPISSSAVAAAAAAAVAAGSSANPSSRHSTTASVKRGLGFNRVKAPRGLPRHAPEGAGVITISSHPPSSSTTHSIPLPLASSPVSQSATSAPSVLGDLNSIVSILGSEVGTEPKSSAVSTTIPLSTEFTHSTEEISNPPRRKKRTASQMTQENHGESSLANEGVSELPPKRRRVTKVPSNPSINTGTSVGMDMQNEASSSTSEHTRPRDAPSSRKRQPRVHNTSPTISTSATTNMDVLGHAPSTSVGTLPQGSQSSSAGTDSSNDGAAKALDLLSGLLGSLMSP